MNTYHLMFFIKIISASSITGIGKKTIFSHSNLHFETRISALANKFLSTSTIPVQVAIYKPSLLQINDIQSGHLSLKILRYCYIFTST